MRTTGLGGPVWKPTVTHDAARGRRAPLGADKACGAAEHIARLRAVGFTPHGVQHTSGRRSAIDGRITRQDHAPGPRARTTRHPGYAISERLRKRIEEPFGWIEAAAGLRNTRHRGLARVGWMVMLTAAACNLVRLPKLLANAAWRRSLLPRWWNAGTLADRRDRRLGH